MSTLTEPFLINPQKSKRKRLHRPVAYSFGKGGAWFTSKHAKVVRPGIRINPFAGGLMSINPHRRHNMRHRKHRRHNPELALSNLGGLNVMSGIQPAAVIGVSLLAGGLVPQFIHAKGYMAVDATWKRYGIQIGTGVAGVMALKAMRKPEWAKYWGVGSLVGIAVDLLSTYVWPSVQAAILPAPAPVVTTPTTSGFGAFPREVSGMGAFPGSVRRVASPYDRATVYPY